jgi:hypothetical protein
MRSELVSNRVIGDIIASMAIGLFNDVGIVGG